MIENILKIKDLTANEKLILIDISLFPAILTYNKTSIDIAASTGIKQKDVKIALNTLEEKHIIETKVSYRARSTRFTKEFIASLK
jgi:DNA-binding MarR family transcriptional regulator